MSPEELCPTEALVMSPKDDGSACVSCPLLGCDRRSRGCVVAWTVVASSVTASCSEVATGVPGPLDSAITLMTLTCNEAVNINAFQMEERHICLNVSTVNPQ